jgi:spore germination protein YaaH
MVAKKYHKLFLVLALLIPSALNAQSGFGKSIHQLQSEQNKGTVSPKAPVTAYAALDRSKSPRISKTVFAYDPYWVAETYVHYDLITHLACFDAEVESTGAVTNLNNFPAAWSSAINLAHQNGVKVGLCATNFSGTEQAALLASASRRTAAVRNLVGLVRGAACEGVNIDFEGLPSSQKQNYVKFIHELADSFHAWDPQSHVSLAVPAVDWSGAYDYDSLAIYSDGLFIMAYDYFWSGSSATGPVSPLDGYSYDVNWTIHDYAVYSGYRRDKLLCGFPYYGYEWPCVSASPGAATTGNGSAVLFSKAETLAYDYGRQWNSASSTPWYCYGSYTQCWFDDEVSLGYKYQTVWDSGLAGTGMWALCYDGSREELWTALRTSFNLPADTLINSNLESFFMDTAAVPSQNRLVPYGWLEGDNATADTASDFVHGGTRALRHRVNSQGKDTPYLSYIFQDVSVSPGSTYLLEGWGRKNDGAGNVMRIRVQWHDAKHAIIAQDTTAALSADNASYVLLTTGNIIAPAGAVFARVKLNIWADSANGYWDRWDDISFKSVAGVQGSECSERITALKLEQNFPNPFSGRTEIRYRAPGGSKVSLRIYNVTGQVVRELTPPSLPSPRGEGREGSIVWDGRDDGGRPVAGGIYICRLQSGGQVASRKMVYVR